MSSSKKLSDFVFFNYTLGDVFKNARRYDSDEIMKKRAIVKTDIAKKESIRKIENIS